MKIRNGFVSNSSSSSFIITIDDKEHKCERCGRSNIDVLELIRISSRYNDDNGVREIGKDNVIRYIEENWYKGDESKIIDKIKSVDDNKTVALVSVSHSDENISDLIHESPNITIIDHWY